MTRARVTIGTRGADRFGMDMTDMRSTKPSLEPPPQESTPVVGCRANGYRITPEGSAHVGARVTKLKALAVANPAKFRRVVLNAFIAARGVLIAAMRVLDEHGMGCSKGTLHRLMDEKPPIWRDVELIREAFEKAADEKIEVDVKDLRKTLKIRVG